MPIEQEISQQIGPGQLRRDESGFLPAFECFAFGANRPSLHRSPILDQPATLRPPASLREALRARRSDVDGEFVNDAASGSPELRNTSLAGAFSSARLC